MLPIETRLLRQLFRTLDAADRDTAVEAVVYGRCNTLPVMLTTETRLLRQMLYGRCVTVIFYTLHGHEFSMAPGLTWQPAGVCGPGRHSRGHCGRGGDGHPAQLGTGPRALTQGSTRSQRGRLLCECVGLDVYQLERNRGTDRDTEREKVKERVRELTLQDYETRCPRGTKTIVHKDAKTEIFAEYLREDGLVRRCVLILLCCCAIVNPRRNFDQGLHVFSTSMLIFINC